MGRTPISRPSSKFPSTSSPRTIWTRSLSFGRPTRRGWWSHGGSSATGEPAPTPGVAPRRVEDVAALGERLMAMSGQFEQRRLSRPSYQLDVLDAFAGQQQLQRRGELRGAWRDLLAARRRHDELTRDAVAAESRLAELRALVDHTAGFEPGLEDALRGEREWFRHTGELVEAASMAVGALDPDDGDGVADLIASAERAVAGVERLAPELGWAGDELRDVELRLREAASVWDVPGLPRRRSRPDRGGRVETRGDRGCEAPLPVHGLRRAAGPRCRGT